LALGTPAPGWLGARDPRVAPSTGAGLPERPRRGGVSRPI